MQSKQNLSWHDIRRLGHTDRAGRWIPCAQIAPYFDNVRTPSRQWPHTWARAALTRKFFDWLQIEHPEIAARFFVQQPARK